jgi:hypothetical protein
MKTILFFTVFLSLGAYCQTYNSGDKELDGFLQKMNEDAKTNLSSVKNDLAAKYTTSVEKIDGFIKKGMAISDIFMSYEIAVLTKKKVDDVVSNYEKNKGKGWGVIAKEMGIKPGSPEFHELKNKTKASSDKPKESKGNKGNSKGKGKG